MTMGVMISLFHLCLYSLTTEFATIIFYKLVYYRRLKVSFEIDDNVALHMAGSCVAIMIRLLSLVVVAAVVVVDLSGYCLHLLDAVLL